MDDITIELGIDREDLISMAYFLGSDYTEGVHGVGLVNSMEIISTFPMKNNFGGPIKGLELFKEWLNGFDIEEMINKCDLDVKKTFPSIDVSKLSPCQKDKLVSFNC
jgi:5'-3' exonuclease